MLPNQPVQSKYSVKLTDVHDIINANMVQRMDVSFDGTKKSRDYPKHSEYYSVGNSFKIEILRPMYPSMQYAAVLKNKSFNTTLAIIYDTNAIEGIRKALENRAMRTYDQLIAEDMARTAVIEVERTKKLNTMQKIKKLIHIH
jgi:hypothetical protein